MRFLPGWDISGSGLAAEQLRLDLIANNVANIHSTRSAGGGPYRRLVPVFAENLVVEPGGGFSGRGVRVAEVVEDTSAAQLAYDPSHPDADARGYVALPNVNVVNEMVDMVVATRAYQANATVLDAAKNMALRGLEIGRG